MSEFSNTAEQEQPNLAQDLKCWLKSRKKLLVAYYQLNRIPPFDDQNHLGDRSLLKHFCQLLLDYITSSERCYLKPCDLIKKQSSRLKKERLEMILEALASHSQYAYLFTEQQRYPPRTISETLRTKISQFGEQLAERMDLEDKLIYEFLVSFL